MRIFLLHQFFGGGESGLADNRYYKLGRILCSQGHQVIVLTDNTYLNRPLGNKRIGLYHLDGMVVVVFNLRYHPEMSKMQKLEFYRSYAGAAKIQGRRLPRPDLVIAVTPPLPVVLPALSLCKHYGVPLFLEVQERWPRALEQRGTLRNKQLVALARRLERKAFDQAECIFTQSAETAGSISLEGVDPARIHELPPASDDETLLKHICSLLVPEGQDSRQADTRINVLI